MMQSSSPLAMLRLPCVIVYGSRTYCLGVTARNKLELRASTSEMLALQQAFPNMLTLTVEHLR
jgi:hypothetical protein